MKIFIFPLIFLLYSPINTAAEHIQTIKAAVAENFSNGLHAKYLRYIANKLNAELSLTTMPFARRLQEIRNGHLDIIVGLQKTEDREDEFIYISPFYESLSFRFFSLVSNKDKIKTFSDLEGKLIGVNKHSKYFPQFNHNDKIHKVNIVSLKQNIQLLLKGRIDLLIHYEESTTPILKSLGVSEQITKTDYQPKHSNRHYIAISNKSHLVKHIDKLQDIVEQAVKNGDFLNIRLQHYKK